MSVLLCGCLCLSDCLLRPPIPIRCRLDLWVLLFAHFMYVEGNESNILREWRYWRRSTASKQRCFCPQKILSDISVCLLLSLKEIVSQKSVSAIPYYETALDFSSIKKWHWFWERFFKLLLRNSIFFGITYSQS